jgi:hypothetical protein
MEISSEQQTPDMLEKWNTAIHDLVTKLPGVTTKNQNSLLIKGQSLDHLISLSKVINTSQAMHVQTLWCLHITILAMEKQYVLHNIQCVFVAYIVIGGLFGLTTFFHIIS